MKYSAALALLFTLNQSSALGQAEKPCSAERARFEQMNRGIFGDHTSTAEDAALYEKNKDSEWRIGTCITGAGPRVETNTLQNDTDHAAYTGLTTPAP